MTAARTLARLEAEAWALEVAHRYDTADRRTVRFEVDATRTNEQMAYGRLCLLVTARYPHWYEQQAFFGHQALGHRLQPKARMTYAVELEGVPLPLRGRRQALEVLETQALPRGVDAPAPREAIDLTDVDELFAEVAARSRTVTL